MIPSQTCSSSKFQQCKIPSQTPKFICHIFTICHANITPINTTQHSHALEINAENGTKKVWYDKNRTKMASWLFCQSVFWQIGIHSYDHIIALHMLLDTRVTHPVWSICCVYTIVYMLGSHLKTDLCVVFTSVSMCHICLMKYMLSKYEWHTRDTSSMVYM